MPLGPRLPRARTRVFGVRTADSMLSAPGRCPDENAKIPDSVRESSAITNKKCSQKARTPGHRPVIGPLLSEDAPPPRPPGVSQLLLEPVRPFPLALQLLPERGLRNRLKLSLAL